MFGVDSIGWCLATDGSVAELCIASELTSENTHLAPLALPLHGHGLESKQTFIHCGEMAAARSASSSTILQLLQGLSAAVLI